MGNFNMEYVRDISMLSLYICDVSTFVLKSLYYATLVHATLTSLDFSARDVGPLHQEPVFI